MSSSDENILVSKVEAEKIFQIYMRVQSGEKTALNELFKTIDSKQISKADEINKEYRMSHMVNVLDSELVIDNEKSKQEEDWVNSSDSRVTFQFSCLNKMLYKKKKDFLIEAKNTGYENGQKIKNSSCSKFYEGEYDISDFNELMYETIIEIFNEKTDANNCLTLDGKKNEKYPICDGVNLLRNISYFTSRKINKRAESSYLDIFNTESWNEETDGENQLATNSYFDEYVAKKFFEPKNRPSRLAIYAEYLEWMQKYDVHKLFKANACDIKTIIETIMNCEDTFIKDMSGDKETGFGMRFVKQELLQGIIKSRHNMNIEQENISKDLEIIEQRLLDHLFYSLIYRIDKATESEGVYEKESERFLYELERKSYIKMFSGISYKIYDKSIIYINSDFSVKDFNNYFDMTMKYKEMVFDVISKEKGRKKYDMINLISDNDYDLVDDKNGTLLNMANTIITSYQKKEDEYRRNYFDEYKIKSLKNWDNGLWEAKLEGQILNIRLWTSIDVKFPIHYKLNRENLIIYCGYMNYYFCDKEKMVCYILPKGRRIIGRYNRNHELFIYNVE